MQIKNIKLENFRGAKVLDIDLHPNINVFVGVNGAGKSTILDAIAISLSWLVERIQKAETIGMSIPDESIKNQSNYASIALEVLENKQHYKWKNIEFERGYPAKEKSSLSELDKLAYSYQVEYQKSKTLPMIVYYPINRIAKGIVDIKGSESISQLDVYDNALGSQANFQSFFEWFRLQDDIVNEQWKEVTRASSNEGRELKIVTKTIEKFIPEYKNLRVTRVPTPRMLIEKNGETLSLNQLSDGEKNMIAMVGDIARRLTMANPHLENPLEGDGIVMIDEVDLHLHSAWQRVIISKLIEVFPNIQFIVTTHSPQILSHVKAESVFLLRQEENNISVTKPTESYGKSNDRQLEDILGVDARPLEIKNELRQLYKLIQDGDLESAKILMNKLDNDIEGREPELVKANVLIKRKEILGK
ncbi:MAG: AAA family ATPase [Sulfurovum sp.]